MRTCSWEIVKMAKNWHGVSLGDNKETLCRIFINFVFSQFLGGQKLKFLTFRQFLRWDYFRWASGDRFLKNSIYENNTQPQTTLIDFIPTRVPGSSKIERIKLWILLLDFDINAFVVLQIRHHIWMRVYGPLQTIGSWYFLNKTLCVLACSSQV